VLRTLAGLCAVPLAGCNPRAVRLSCTSGGTTTTTTSSNDPWVWTTTSSGTAATVPTIADPGGKEDHPVFFVSGTDATTRCAWLETP